MNYPYIEQFQSNLVDWFQREKRDLPWRHTTEPYKIWVSEVMLQQTRVDTVIPYYERFLEKFPTAEDFAYATEDEILKMWEGLGYYSRVRNLQTGVREVVEQYGGIVPNNRKEISALKGVGPYTAGAVLSIAYNMPEHAVDGNVMRVLSRVLLIEEDIAIPKTKKIFEEAVMMLIDRQHPSDFNQGLMELGAMICTPTSPKCLLCPVREYCIAFTEGKQQDLPIKTKKTKTKKLFYDVFVIENERGEVLMQRRPEKGLLANMWQFPMVEKSEESPEKQLFVQTNVEVYSKESLLQLKHVFTHLVWHLNSAFYKTQSTEKLPDAYAWLSLEQVEKNALPVPMQKIWKAYRIERSL